MIDNYRKLIEKYNESGPRYTSYPPATFFSESYGNDSYIESIDLSNTENPKNVSVYVHVPFCPQICHFCGCTTETGFSRPFLERYEKVKPFLDNDEEIKTGQIGRAHV